MIHGRMDLMGVGFPAGNGVENMESSKTFNPGLAKSYNILQWMLVSQVS